MGFDITDHSAIIYDSGTEDFTGTTLEGIGQSVVGVLQNLEETKDRFVKVRSIKTNQKALLEAFEAATEEKWSVKIGSIGAMKESGQANFKAGVSAWILELLVAQLYDEGQARCVLVADENKLDPELLGVLEETPAEVVAKVLKAA